MNKRLPSAQLRSVQVLNLALDRPRHLDGYLHRLLSQAAATAESL
jgi:hypothetical protein